MKREHLLSDGKLTITWKGEKCLHKAFCLKGIVNDIDKAGVTLHSITPVQYKSLLNQAKICPSGARIVP